jgi:cytochrome c-type biogenesis protein CcmE
MNNRKTKRALAVSALISFVAIGIWILATNLNQNITFFYTPSELQNVDMHHNIRIGGIVRPNSIKKNGVTVSFAMTDCIKDITVYYKGVLPSLFREKQGIVALGKLDSANIFQATQLLAKHDENYSPKGLEKNISEESLCKSIQYKS